VDTNNIEIEQKRLTQNDSALDEKFIFANDPYTLKVRGGEGTPDNPKKPTDPVALSRAVLHVLADSDYVRILSVGPKALNITMKAFRLAAQEAESRTNGAVLVARQSEYEAIVANKKTKGICTRIFGIPIKNCL
jgi:hypothetical protein